MFHIIVVDDEETIRNGIASCIKRNYPQLSIDGVFEDGSDAIDFLRDHDTDIVLTDVKMSKKSGIDVAQYIYDNKPNIKVAFLSAYREFEYARKAIELNVKNYLSKPVKTRELKAAIDEMIKLISRERENEDMISESRKKYETLYESIKTELFTDILLGSITDDEIIRRAMTVELSEKALGSLRCCVVDAEILNFDNWHYGKEDFYVAISNIINDIPIVFDCVSIMNTAGHSFYVLLSETDAATGIFFDMMSAELNKAEKEIKSILSSEVKFNILHVTNSVFDLSACDIINENNNELSLVSEKYKELIAVILSGDLEKTMIVYKTLKRYLVEMEIDDQKKKITEIVSMLLCAVPNAEEAEKIIDIDTLKNLNNKNELLKWCDKTINEIFNFVSVRTSNMQDLTILKAKKFIEENFASDISLDDISGHVYLSRVYFSRFFKQKTGINVVEYLLEVRMNEAKKLLRQREHKMADIAKMCGYKSNKYFGRVFKQFTGYTPTEFARMSENDYRGDL